MTAERDGLACPVPFSGLGITPGKAVHTLPIPNLREGQPENRLKSIFGGAGFYVVLALCVLAVGVAGSFVLFGGRDKPADEQVPRRTDLITPSTPEPAAPELPALVETISPAPVEEEKEEETPPPMPELPVDDTPVVVEAPRLIVSPLNGEVVTAFSVDQLVYSETLGDWRTHDGLDISAVQGTTVLAASSGTVSSVTDDPLMGTTVVIRHDGGYQTTYSNLQARPNVEAGDSVSAGQIIGAVGRTAAAESAQGPHLHFSVTKDGVPVDPSEYLKR